ncbi:dipeptidase PepE [Flavobacterium sp.]|uniref:dipeptidase PepE n=1 Tax=Flavobacterium sp. TaxID=239 RepID=UPI00262CC77C|nr:dipeptidase PepE [Flavobacterium sp.]
MKKMVIASTSTLHGGAYLDYLLPRLSTHFEGVKTLVFIPFARPGGLSHDAYTAKVQEAFAKIGIAVVGLHTFANPKQAVLEAEALFTGGGNTFQLVSQLYALDLWENLRMALAQGTPYLGCSAGSNITGLSMQTTNDMPIVYPPSFETLGAIPFNLNPHYLDPDPSSTHMGETRETRIQEFHVYNSIPVLGLREGSWLEVEGDRIRLMGTLTGRWFTPNQTPMELVPGTEWPLEQ